jgi:hypothetical protein
MENPKMLCVVCGFETDTLTFSHECTTELIRKLKALTVRCKQLEEQLRKEKES